MAYKSLFLAVLFILASLLWASISEAASSNGVGTWTPINPTDPDLLLIGFFAVREHNKEGNKPLVFVNVVKADVQVAGETYYRLVVGANDGGPANPDNYLALVLSKSEESVLQLLYFQPA